MEPVEVDGSFGEGGGQILRTALAFSVIHGTPVHISRIRASRPTPGLRQQHSATVRIFHEIFGGELRGAEVGSSEITFIPGRPTRRSLAVDMKTAASITLVLQAVVPAVALTGSGLSLELTGGTDVPWSPTFDYLSNVARAGYELLGIRFSAACTRRGYYPVGGGRVKVEVEPCPKITPAELSEAPAKPQASVISRCSRLPGHVAERQLSSAVSVLEAHGMSVGRTEVTQEDSSSPGSSILLYSVQGVSVLGSDAIGARWKPAEDVGREAGEGYANLLGSSAAADPHLADMLAPLMTLSDRDSHLLVPDVSLHLRTGMYVAGLFNRHTFSEESRGSAKMLSIRGA